MITITLKGGMKTEVHFWDHVVIEDGAIKFFDYEYDNTPDQTLVLAATDKIKIVNEHDRERRR